MLPLLAVLVGGSLGRYHADHARGGQHTLELARGMAGTVGRELRSLVAGLQVLAQSRALRDGEADARRVRVGVRVDDYLGTVAAGSAVAVTDRSGRQVLNTAQPAGEPLPERRGNPEHVARVFETGQAVVSEVYAAALDDRPLLSIGVPALRGGEVPYVLGLAPTLGLFADIIAGQRLPEGYVASIVDRAGVHVAREPSGDRFMGQPVNARLRAAMAAAPEGVIEATSLEGVPLLVAFSRTEPSGWAVAIGVPLAVLDAPVDRALWSALGAVLAALAAGLLLARAVGRQVLWPMRALTRLAAGRDAGWPGGRFGLREADAVASALRLAALDREAASAERERLMAQLAQERARLAAVVDAAPVGLVFAEGPGGRIVGGNRRTEAIVRHPVWSTPDVQSYRRWASSHPDGRDVRPEEYPLARALRGEERPELEVLYHCGDGTRAWVRLIAAPTRDAAGAVTGGVVAILDIDQERRAAEALAASQAQLRGILESMDEALVTMDRDFRITGANAAAARMDGRPAHAIVGQSYWTVWPGSIDTALERGYRRAVSEGVPVALEHHYRSSVHDIWLDVRAYPTAEGLAVFHRDIADRKQAEEKARYNAELFRAIGDTTPDLIFMKDRESRMTYANPALLSAVGRSWELVAGRTDAEWSTDPAEAAAILAADRRVIDGGCTEAVEEMFTGPRGRRVFLSTKAPMRDADGVVSGLVGVSTDITERNRAEEQRTLLIHELNHRVKNTLATVQGIAQQALRGADPALRRAFEARLMALSAAHDVLTRENWEGANLNDVADAALRAHASSGRLLVHGPALRLEPKTALALAMALHELCTNAAKYGALSGPAGRVSLDWAVTGQGGERRLLLTWRERGGPAVAPPAHRGFGSRLVERALAQELRGEVRIRFEPEGMACTIDAPLPPERAEPRETAS